VGGGVVNLVWFEWRGGFGFSFHAADAWEGVPADPATENAQKEMPRMHGEPSTSPPATPPKIHLVSVTFGDSLKAIGSNAGVEGKALRRG